MGQTLPVTSAKCQKVFFSPLNPSRNVHFGDFFVFFWEQNWGKRDVKNLFSTSAHSTREKFSQWGVGWDHPDWEEKSSISQRGIDIIYEEYIWYLKVFGGLSFGKSDLQSSLKISFVLSFLVFPSLWVLVAMFFTKRDLHFCHLRLSLVVCRLVCCCCDWHPIANVLVATQTYRRTCDNVFLCGALRHITAGF